MGAEVHVRGVAPDEERRPRRVLALDDVDRPGQDLVVDRLHALFRQRPGVLDPLRAVLVRPAVDDTARAEALAEVREIVGRRVVGELRLLLGVQVVEVAQELVETVRSRQELVLVPEVVRAELTRRIPEWLQQLRDRRILGLQAEDPSPVVRLCSSRCGRRSGR
jgi:hypothetical protein